MYELTQVGENTFYIESPAKMGVFRINKHEVCLIDSGNDQDAGKKVEKILAEKEWTLKFILNTHSNADHIGGNAILQKRLGVPAYASEIEACFNQFPILEPSFLYGGYPHKQLRNKFLMAQPSTAQTITLQNIPAGLEILPLEGHFFGMIGVKTPDQVWFLADCVMGENILQKYHVSFIYDVAAYLETLNTVETLQGKCFVAAHAPVCTDIHPLMAANRAKVLEIIEHLLVICQNPLTFDQILQHFFDDYHLTLDWNQYVLVGSTIRSYLSYLLDANQVDAAFKENQLIWQTK